jgi:uncharacterized protein
VLGVLEKLREHWWCQTDDLGYDIPLTTVNQVNVLGEAPIHIAARYGSADDVLWLLENGANVNQRGDFDMTPLHYAYMGGNRETIECLLRQGADPNLRCDRGLVASTGREPA